MRRICSLLCCLCLLILPVSAEGVGKYVALTFDDGPSGRYTDRLLDGLKERGAHATFLLCGYRIKQYPAETRRILDEGHEIGNHGYKHPHPDQLSVEQNQKDIIQSENILEKLTGQKPVLYAPPYGEHGQTCLQAAEQCGYTTILWTADTVDWEEPAPSHDTLVQRVTGDKLGCGAIILMHPKPHTVEALTDIIGTIKAKGYQCVKVSEVL